MRWVGVDAARVRARVLLAPASDGANPTDRASARSSASAPRIQRRRALTRPCLPRGRMSRLLPGGCRESRGSSTVEDVSGGSFPAWSSSEQVRVLIPAFAVGTALIAALTDPSSGTDLLLCGLAAAPFLVWGYVGGVPLFALSLTVIVPAVAAQRSGQ